MSLVSGFAIYFIIWWVVLFTTLPYGARPPENVEAGHDHGAPARPMILQKMIATTLISGVIFGLIYWAIATGMIDFYPQ